jgi:predicted secreted protein
MTWVSLAAIYIVVWWICLFVVLPIGVRTQGEEGDTILGTPESAPLRPMLLRKALATTVLAAIVVGVAWLVVAWFDIDIDGLSRMFGPQ